MGNASRWIEHPAANVAASALLLHIPWEVAQMPLYRCAETLSRRRALAFCTVATVGDAAIAAGAYQVVRYASKSRDWVFEPSRAQTAGFIAAGLAATVVFERLATEVLDRWQYAPVMPRLPGLGTGLAPLLQWTVLPPLTLWLISRRARQPPRKEFS